MVECELPFFLLKYVYKTLLGQYSQVGGIDMELVIFDLDGVIVSTDAFHYKAWKSLANKYFFIFNEEINHLLRGVSRAESLKIILDVNGRDVDSETFEKMLDEKNDLYRSSLGMLDSTHILPGVNKLLKDLKENGIKVAIGSSSKNAPMILKQIGLAEAFDVIVDGNSLVHSKPHPEVFLKAAKALEISPDQCLVYEDASAGIEAAKAAGMYAIGVGNHQLIDADYMVENLENESYKHIIEQLEV